MRSKLNKKIFIALLTLLIIGIAVSIVYKSPLYYYIVGDYPQPDKKCHEKRMTWDKGVYLIDKNPNGGKIVLKVENRNEDAWYVSLLPIQSQMEQFKTCTKGVQKYPSDTENSVAWKELEPRSKGLEVSIGIQEPFKYVPIAHLIFNIRLFSSRFNDESYNLDVAVQNIAENFYLNREPDNSLHLYFQAKLGEKFDTELPFNYDFVRLNGKEINATSEVEFISKDDGKTWLPVIVKKL